jgi:hypothetical protein
MTTNAIEAKAEYRGEGGLKHTQYSFHDAAKLTGHDVHRLLEGMFPTTLSGSNLPMGIFGQNSVEHAPAPTRMDIPTSSMMWLHGAPSLRGNAGDIELIKKNMRENPSHGFYDVEPGENLHKRFSQLPFQDDRMVPVRLYKRGKINVDDLTDYQKGLVHHDIQLGTVASSNNINKPVPVKSAQTAMKYKDNRKMIAKKLGLKH